MRSRSARPAAAACALAACVPFTAPATAAAAPPPLEPARVHRVPLPPGAGSMTFPRWLPDGRRLIGGFTSPRWPNAQIAVIRPDGAGFRCITCGLEQIVLPDRPLNAGRPLDLGKPFPFSDGRRVLVRQPGREQTGRTTSAVAGPTADYNYFVLECDDGVATCADRRLVPVVLPGGGLLQGVQNREGRVSPDGRWFAWTEVQADGARMSLGRLVRREASYGVRDVRVLNPRFRLGRDSRDWALAGPLYELKNFSFDGRTVTYAAFATAENYDVWELDLRSGRRRRLTRDIEWNESMEISPDGRWMVNGTSRARARMAPFAQLPRPPFIDFATYALLGRFALNDENRTCLLDQWLVARGGEQGTYFGQPLNPDVPRGWGSHGPGSWSPDGTRYAFWERSPTAAGTPASPDARMLVVTLTARRPTRPPRTRRTPEPRWAVPREQWDGFADTNGRFVVPGRRSGTVTLDLQGRVGSQSWSATYSRYSDDGRTFLDGYERTLAPQTIQSGTWQADLRLSGAQRGSLRADVTVRAGGAGSGTVTSVLDGVRYSGLPSAECGTPEVPALRVRAGGGRTRLTVRVTARVPGDRVARPVRGATVTAGALRGHTDARGRVVLQRRVGDRADRVRATAAGFTPATAEVASGR